MEPIPVQALRPSGSRPGPLVMIPTHLRCARVTSQTVQYLDVTN